jgi:hypothetical protein
MALISRLEVGISSIPSNDQNHLCGQVKRRARDKHEKLANTAARDDDVVQVHKLFQIRRRNDQNHLCGQVSERAQDNGREARRARKYIRS